MGNTHTRPRQITRQELINASKKWGRVYLSVINSYIEQNADSPDALRDCDEALVWAAFYGNLAIVNRLLNVPGIDVNNTHAQNGSTALIYAAYAGNIAIVNRLLNVPGINVNAISNAPGGGYGNRNSALIAAAIRGHIPVVDRLLNVLDINITYQNASHHTAAQEARLHGNPNMAAVLAQGERLSRSGHRNIAAAIVQEQEQEQEREREDAWMYEYDDAPGNIAAAPLNLQASIAPANIPEQQAAYQQGQGNGLAGHPAPSLLLKKPPTFQERLDIAGYKSKDIPDWVIDPITFEVMDDPVTIPESGQTYNRSTIEKLAAGKESFPDPMTRTIVNSARALSTKTNWKMKGAIEWFVSLIVGEEQKNEDVQNSGGSRLPAGPGLFANSPARHHIPAQPEEQKEEESMNSDAVFFYRHQ